MRMKKAGDNGRDLEYVVGAKTVWLVPERILFDDKCHKVAVKICPLLPRYNSVLSHFDVNGKCGHEAKQINC